MFYETGGFLMLFAALAGLFFGSCEFQRFQ
jgi:hypothetical protein